MADRENVGPGWQPIIDTLEERLGQIAPGYKVVQIKEKFGGLRYYVALPQGSDWEAAQRAISEAEGLSLSTCEDCGAPGEQKGPGWIRTVCDPCYTDWQERRRRMLNGEQF